MYVTRVLSGERAYGAVTNVGVRPTVEEGGGITVESHLLDQDLQLYGSLCRVEFLAHIRPERRFEDLEALGGRSPPTPTPPGSISGNRRNII